MNALNDYQAVLFDAGGTLITRHPADDEVLLQRWQSTGITANLPEVRLAVKQSELWIGEQIMREMVGAPRMPDDEFIRKVDQSALQAVFPEADEGDITRRLDCLASLPKVKQTWKRLPGAQEILQTLYSRGIRMGVVSNFNQTLPDLLASLGLDCFFETIVCSAMVGVEKPHPEIMFIACQQLGIQPEKALYVGDHPLDIWCAKRAGMAVAWLREPGDQLPGYIGYSPDIELDDLEELIQSMMSG